MQLFNFLVVLSTLFVDSANSIVQAIAEAKKQVIETTNVLRKDQEKLQQETMYWSNTIYNSDCGTSGASPLGVYYGMDGQCLSVGGNMYQKNNCNSDGGQITYSVYSTDDCSGSVTYTSTFNTDECQIGNDNMFQCSDTSLDSNNEDEDDDVCFAGSETLLLEHGISIAMQDVQVGDRVQVASASDSAITFADVVFLPHKKNNLQSTFVEIETVSGASLKVTPFHLVMAGTCGTTEMHLIRASDVAVGTCMDTVFGETAVTASTMTQGKGIYTAVTSHPDGIIVVNGFKASSFAANHAAVNNYYNIHRLLYANVPAMAVSLTGLGSFLGPIAGSLFSI